MQLIPEYTVSELMKTIRTIIEGALYYVKVTGEVSNLKVSSAGHIYFSLKDSEASLNVVSFHNSSPNSGLRLEDGLNLLVRGRMTIYKEKSVFQVIAERWEAHGVGALLRIIEDRKRKLKSEGLFDRKRPIPEKIRKVGLITAPNGAAIRDIEVCLRDRLPIDSITLYPSLVQGQNADSSIMMGIRYFNGSEPTDVIVITRGGGSVEDLMCFNSEPLAREIFGSRIPVITAIGHEIDWTLADYVSDLRLPTPTAVASFMSPLKKEVSLRVDLIFRKIIKSITSLFERFLPRINSIFQGIRCTLGRNFNDRLSLLDNLEQRLSAFNREKILRQGYGIVRKAGKVVTRSTALVSGDLLEIEILGKKFTASVL